MEVLSQVFTGSPIMVSHDKAFAIARDECMPLYKARRLSLSGAFVLDKTEALITYKKLESSLECAIALAQLGCGQEVVIIEGLCLLEQEFNLYLECRVNLLECRLDCDMIFQLSSKGSIENLQIYKVATSKKDKGIRLSKKEEDALALNIGGQRGGICKFINGLMLAAQRFESNDQNVMKLHGTIQAAAKHSGGVVYKDVLASVVGDHSHMQSVLSQPRLVFAAWNEVFYRQVNRNIKSHPFLMINSDVETARKALAAFEFLIPSNPTLKPLMEASIPLIVDAIKAAEQKKSMRKLADKDTMDATAELLGLDI